MALTNRDKILLSTLQSYGCLRTSEIAQKVFTGIRLTTVLRRLRCLEQSGFIQKICGLESTERLWALTEKTMESLLEGAAKIHFPKAILEHDSRLSSLRLRLEELKVAESWVPEHEIRRQVANRYGVKEGARKVIPDGLMGTDVGGVKVSIALELELTNKNQRRYRDILRDYSAKKNVWAVWYVTQSQSIDRQILKAKRSLYLSDDRPRMLFSNVDDVTVNGFSARIDNGETKSTLRDLFDHKSTEVPAHLHAHEVSTLGKEKRARESEISARNEDKT